MQELQIATTAHSSLDVAASQIHNRSLLYDKDENKLYVKYNDELRQISCSVDNDNIVINEYGEVALADDVHCRTMTVFPDDSGLKMHGNIIFGSTTPERTVLPLIKMSDNYFGAISGELYEKSDNPNTPLESSYHFSISSTGSRTLNGASTGDKAKFVNLTYDGEAWVGIKFPSKIPSTIYFHGFDYRPFEVTPIPVDDADYANIAEISDDANFATKVIHITPTVTEITTWEDVENSNYSWDFTTVPRGFNNSNKFPEAAWGGNWSSMGSNNRGVDFGNGLVLTTTSGTYIDTTSVSYGASGDNYGVWFNETNRGCIRFANSNATSITSTFDLAVKGKVKTCYVYFISGSSTTRTCTVTGLAADGTVTENSAWASATGSPAQSPGTGMNILRRVSYYDDIEGEHTLRISHSAQMSIYKIEVVTTEQQKKITYEIQDPSVDDLNQAIQDLPETGENGSPHQITFTLINRKLSYNDLVGIANNLKRLNTRVTLDLSGCTTSYTDWKTAIFANCTSLYSLYLPEGVEKLNSSDMFINTNLHVLTLNTDLRELATNDIFAGAAIQMIDFRRLATYPSNMSWHCLYGMTLAAEIWTNKVIYTRWTTQGTNEYWNFGQDIGKDVELNIGINGTQILYKEDDVEWKK